MSTTPSNPSVTLERDPVCGMNVNAATAKHIYNHGGKNYHFCCAGCVEKFKADPAKYLEPARSSGLVMPGSAQNGLVTPGLVNLTPPNPSHQPARHSGPAPAYVCPMCPEVRENKPGACPSCGMALEPEIPVAAVRTEYTCPMHPEIVRPTPGSCPICGMALEPRTVTAGAEENSELRDMSRRFWISLALTAPLMAIAMASMLWPDFLCAARIL